MKKKLIYGLTTGAVLVAALAFLGLNYATNADDSVTNDTTEVAVTTTNDNVETSVFVTDGKVGTTAAKNEFSGNLGSFEAEITGSKERQFTIRSIIEDYIRFPEFNDVDSLDDSYLTTEDELIQALPPFEIDDGEEFNYHGGYSIYPPENQAINPSPEFPEDALTIKEAKQLLNDYKASIGVE
ncbi:hypothetical protein [Streptococcus zalophi]|uniref:Uncharacterized protein n=1 Tax=Streptococcus zalophi TaxID=640031 RepID=A0A934PB57_9STRE|nr:hypothetical protein [Streptococcus zalophi]MBJ8350299.1 hypothetical protein [Streptococcus zalophi]MCR8968272.1 hypothetical protein [Streptococcus zalophi]